MKPPHGYGLEILTVASIDCKQHILRKLDGNGHLNGKSGWYHMDRDLKCYQKV
jgi:hypothetical protein